MNDSRFSPENKGTDTLPKKSELVDVVGAESASVDEPSESHSGT